jgi:DNA-binding transcriptional ArsR family regulator
LTTKNPNNPLYSISNRNLFNDNGISITRGISIKQIWHPNAYLKNIRNVRSGLSARTKILDLLDGEAFSAAKIAKASGLHYGVVMYHLRLLKNEGMVQRKGTRRFVWLSTGIGQKRLS